MNRYYSRQSRMNSQTTFPSKRSNSSSHSNSQSVEDRNHGKTFHSLPGNQPKLMNNERLLEDSDDDEKDCFQACAGAKSPLSWICEMGQEKNQSNTNPAVANKINSFHQTATKNSYETRKKATKNFFQAESDDEANLGHQYTTITQTETMMPEMPVNHSSQSVPTLDLMERQNHPIPNSYTAYGTIGNSDIVQVNPGHTPNSGEARIVAPHVSKLAPYSAVEVRLQSTAESVAVLCSVDVLKMRSGFFHDILNEQEKTFAMKHAAGGGAAIGLNHPLQSNMLWRDPIVIPESTPFEAAAFLESLHEGRALFKGEWNLCWARLSVTWVVEDLIVEYASQIEEHMNKVASVIQNNHWRTNPSILAGMRVAVFRKSNGNYPTVITGVILDSPSNIGYSKVRVAFDNDRPTSAARMHHSSHYPPPLTVPASYNVFSPPDHHPALHSSSLRLNDLGDNSHIPQLGRSVGPVSVHSVGQTTNNAKSSPTSTITTNEQQIVGDVTEPIWVQSAKEGSQWYEPDELFLLESKRFLSSTDKRIFWEMARALIELPEISLACKSGIKSPQDLAITLKRLEYRVLWMKDAPDYLPKEITSELIRAAYLSNHSITKYSN